MISPNNKKFKTIDNVLFNMDEKILVVYPSNKNRGWPIGGASPGYLSLSPAKYIIPDWVESIAAGLSLCVKV